MAVVPTMANALLEVRTQALMTFRACVRSKSEALHLHGFLERMESGFPSGVCRIWANGNGSGADVRSAEAGNYYERNATGLKGSMTDGRPGVEIQWSIPKSTWLAKERASAK